MPLNETPKSSGFSDLVWPKKPDDSLPGPMRNMPKRRWFEVRGILRVGDRAEIIQTVEGLSYAIIARNLALTFDVYTSVYIVACDLIEWKDRT